MILHEDMTKLQKLPIVQTIAEMCYETCRIYRESLGDVTVEPWDEVMDLAKLATIYAVCHRLKHPNEPQSVVHDLQCKMMIECGWTYGEVNDPEAMISPILVPYDQLPLAQRNVDHLFNNIVKIMQGMVQIPLDE